MQSGYGKALRKEAMMVTLFLCEFGFELYHVCKQGSCAAVHRHDSNLNPGPKTNLGCRFDWFVRIIR